MNKIKRLGELREELAALLGQTEEMQKRATLSPGSRKPSNRKIPRRFGLIREASTTLRESLMEAWNSSCDDTAHIQHTTILCLDTKVDDSVCLDLAISSTKSEKLLEDSLQGPPTWLYVRSSMTKTEPARRNKRPLVSSDQFLEDVAGSGGQRIETRDRKDATRADEQRGSVSVKITAGQYSNRDKSISKNWGYKRRRAQFMHDVTQDVPNTATAPQQFFRDPELSEPASQTPFELNLCKCSNICKHFEQQCHNINGKQRYLGYLSSTKAFKHFVYAASGQPNSSYGSVQQSPITLLEFIKNATDDTMTMIDQLIIVQKLAVTVLQFWTTPWLQEQWELQQIALFRTSTGDTQSVLRTLHLSALFPRSEKEKGKCIPRSQHPKISDSVPPALKAEQKQCASQLTEPE
ncbi:MAG: hypothetical protein M1820_008605, partial [Bogoriella megaspora]